MDGDSFEKHLGVEDRRRRFDPGSKYGGRGGKSLLKANNYDYIPGRAEIYLKISRPADEDGNTLVTSLDQEFEDLPLEERGGGHLFKLPEMLEERCVSKSVERNNHGDGVIVTTYALEGTAWLTPSEEEMQKLIQRRHVRLSLARAVPCTSEGMGMRSRIFCRFRDTPLECITDPSLLDHHASLVSSDSLDKAAQKARVFQENAAHCWCPSQELPSCHYLQVDLGADCCVTTISTQGRFPPIKGPPDKETGVRLVSEFSPEFQNWVSRYEVSYRVASGREWLVAAENLAGNDDMCTEVAHALGAGEGVRCRFLRFKVLAFVGKPAMRVGVYGERSSQGGAAPVPTENLVKYSIFCAKPESNRRRAPAGRFSCGCCARKSCRNHTLPPPGVRRKRLRQGAVEEVRRLGPDIDLTPHMPEVPEVPEDDDAEVAPPAVEPPPRPTLLRTRSGSEGDFSAAASSSLGDSVLMVNSVESLSAFDEDDWLVV